MLPISPFHFYYQSRQNVEEWKKIGIIPLKWRKVGREGNYYKSINSLWLETIYMVVFLMALNWYVFCSFYHPTDR
jgi:hypothetical protein